MIVQFSTGGRSGAGRERGGMLHLRPDMASLATGSCNFPTRVYENPPELIDWLAAEMLATASSPRSRSSTWRCSTRRSRWSAAGKIKGPLHVQFVLGVKNAMPADREMLEFYVAHAEAAGARGTWTAPASAGTSSTLNRWSLELGGHCRTGLEDNVRCDRTRWRRATPSSWGGSPSSCAEYGRPVATVRQAREMLRLP